MYIALNVLGTLHSMCEQFVLFILQYVKTFTSYFELLCTIYFS